MNHALPTPLQLSQQITLLIAEKAKCSGSWEQHKQPLSAVEFLLIRAAVAELLDEMLQRHMAEVER